MNSIEALRYENARCLRYEVLQVPTAKPGYRKYKAKSK